MNGIEVADNIHKLHLGSTPHLLMISAHGLEAYQEKGEHLKFAGFLVKPREPHDTLERHFCRLLGKKAALPRLAEMAEAGGEALALRRGAQILLVEDNEINQEVASRLMERMGMRVTLADNGLNCGQYLQTKKFDIIFMDIQMPIMDGAGGRAPPARTGSGRKRSADPHCGHDRPRHAGRP